eukprot:403337908
MNPMSNSNNYERQQSSKQIDDNRSSIPPSKREQALDDQSEEQNSQGQTSLAAGINSHMNYQMQQQQQQQQIGSRHQQPNQNVVSSNPLTQNQRVLHQHNILSGANSYGGAISPIQNHYQNNNQLIREQLQNATQLSQSQPINIRIPETIIGGRYLDTKLLSNEGIMSNTMKHQSNPSGNLFSMQKQDLLQVKTVSQTKLNYNLLEEKTCEWLQLNLEKSKTGKFVPVSVKKIKPKKEMRTQLHLDFFVVSALQNYNNAFKQVRNSLTGSDQFFIQRYIPTKGEFPQVLRGQWKKNQGYKFYQLESCYPFNGDRNQIKNKNVTTTLPNSQQQSSSNDQRELENHVNLIFFDDLSTQFSETAKMSFDQLSTFLQTKEIIPQLNQVDYQNSKLAKIDYQSKKNLQHLMLQYKIETEQQTYQPQFLILDKDHKTYIQTKLRGQDDETHLIVSQIQNQMNDLIRAISDKILNPEGLELLRITADFVQDYQDNKVYFLQIKSFYIEEQPQQQNMGAFDSLPNHRKNLTTNDLQFQLTNKFNCAGDYCYISEQNMVPKHLAPIIAKLLNHEHLKVSNRTILLERENMKDNYRAYNKSELMFHTMNEQETLLRKSLEGNHDQDVCPSCFHVYQFLQQNYYNQSPISQRTASQKISTLQSFTNQPFDYIQQQQRENTILQQQYLQGRDQSFMQQQVQQIGKLPHSPVNQNFNYQLYGGTEEIKEDQYEENADSKRELSEQNLDSKNHRIIYTNTDDQGEFEREYDSENNIIDGNGSAIPSSRYNINLGLEETNSPEDFERDSKFRIPSDVNFSDNKRTFISQIDPRNHQRAPSNGSVFTNVIHYDQSSQNHDQNNQLRTNYKLSPTKTHEKSINEDDEFNPKPKYKIQSRQLSNLSLNKMRTSHFGKIVDRQGNAEIQTQTFNIAQIIKNIQVKQQESQRESIKSSIEKLKSQTRPQTELKNYLIKQPTLLNKKISEQNIISKKVLNDLQMNSPSMNHLQDSSLRTSFSKNRTNNVNVQTSLPIIQTEQKSRNIDIQVGESLSFNKPPLAIAHKLNPYSQKQTLESQLSNQLQPSQTFLDTQNKLKILTQQNSINSSKVSNLSPQKSMVSQKSSQLKNNSDHTAKHNEIKLPPLVLDDETKRSIRSSLENVSIRQYEQKPSLVLQIPNHIDSKVASPNSNRSLLSYPSRNYGMSMKSNSKSRKLSLKSNKIDIYVPNKQFNIESEQIDKIPSLHQPEIQNFVQNIPPIITNLPLQNDCNDRQNTNQIQDQFMPTSINPSKTNFPVIESQDKLTFTNKKESDKLSQNSQPSRNNKQSDKQLIHAGESSSKANTMLKMFINNDPEKKLLSSIDNTEQNGPSQLLDTYDVIIPKSPPRLILDNSPLLQSLPKKLQQSIMSKQDSFFGPNMTKSIEDEYLIDYIISNEDGEMSSIINSNPQLRSIIQNRKSMLGLIDQNGHSKNVNNTLNGTNSINNTAIIRPFNNVNSTGSVEGYSEKVLN